MKIDNIYIGFISLIKNEEYILETQSTNFKLQFVKAALIYQKKHESDFYDLKTGIKYKKNGDCFLSTGDLIVDLRKGIIPFRTFYGEISPQAQTLSDNISKRKVLKLYNSYQNNNNEVEEKY